MILKEDYFKDLNMTDEDIASSDSDAVCTDDLHYANPTEYYNAMTSEYTHYMIFEIRMADILRRTDRWTVDIPRMIKKVMALFNTYGIEYSQPIVVEAIASIFLKSKFMNGKFMDFYGYKLITRCDTLEDLDKNPVTQNGVINMMLFFKLPEAHSYITACRFISNIMQCLWKNGKHNRFLEVFTVYSFNKSADKQYAVLRIYSPYWNTLKAIDKTTKYPDHTVVDILNLFFPEKSRLSLIKELNKDKQLLIKLYKCFPNY